MKEPFSQKSSESGDTPADDGDKQEQPQTKLRLKPMVPTKSGSGEDAEDRPRATPDQSEANLKLKQLMSPLSPHIQKVRESEHKTRQSEPLVEPPSAVPIEEPPVDAAPPAEKPPVDPDPPAQAPPVAPGSGTVKTPELKPTVQPIPTTPKPRAEPTGSQPEEAQHRDEPPAKPAPKAEKLVSSPKKKSRVLKVAILAVNALIILTAIQYFFDPLGLTIDPVERPSPSIQEGEQQEPEVNTVANAIAPIETYDDLEAISLESFIGQLEEARIIVSKSPEGVIINSIFYPVGSTLNPQLGLKVGAVETVGNEPILRVVDDEGKEYAYPAN